MLRNFEYLREENERRRIFEQVKDARNKIRSEIDELKRNWHIPENLREINILSENYEAKTRILEEAQQKVAGVRKLLTDEEIEVLDRAFLAKDLIRFRKELTNLIETGRGSEETINTLETIISDIQKYLGINRNQSQTEF